MNGFEYAKDDPYSTVSVKALRVRLRNRLPDLQPIMQQRVEAFFEREISERAMTSGIPIFYHRLLRLCQRLR